jgi:hypothetical protein
MKPGELRAWCLTETVPKSRNPFLVIDIADDGSVTTLDDGIEYTFRHHDLEMYSVELPEADHETG